jgi:hypothetical protein
MITIAWQQLTTHTHKAQNPLTAANDDPTLLIYMKMLMG